MWCSLSFYRRVSRAYGNNKTDDTYCWLWNAAIYKWRTTNTLPLGSYGYYWKYWNPYVQLKQKIINPSGEVKPETEIYYLLANKMGFSQKDIQNNIPEPNDHAIEQWLNKFLDQYDELSLEKLKEGPILAPGLEEIAFSNNIFNTESGKIELYSKK